MVSLLSFTLEGLLRWLLEKFISKKNLGKADSGEKCGRLTQRGHHSET